MCPHDRLYFLRISSVWAGSYLVVDPLSPMMLEVIVGLCAPLEASDSILRKMEDVEMKQGFKNPLAATKRAVERRYALNIGGDGSFTCGREQRGGVVLAGELVIRHQVANL